MNDSLRLDLETLIARLEQIDKDKLAVDYSTDHLWSRVIECDLPRLREHLAEKEPEFGISSIDLPVLVQITPEEEIALRKALEEYKKSDQRAIEAFNKVWRPEAAQIKRLNTRIDALYIIATILGVGVLWSAISRWF